MPDPEIIKESKQLLVEGKDAWVFFEALLNNMQLPGIQVQNFGGKDELRGFLKALKNVHSFSWRVFSLGIVRDAEDGPTAAFRSVRGALRNSRLATPTQPEILEGNNPQVAVLILPNLANEGMLETILLDSVARDPAMQCVNDYFACLDQCNPPLPNNMPKARVQAFLASRPRPGLLLGQAAHAGYWPFDSSVFNHVKNFLRIL